MLPVLMFSAARAGVPVTPLNYRLSAATLLELIDRLPQPLIVADAPYLDAVGRAGNSVVSSQVEGTLSIIKENSPTDFVIEQTLQTMPSAKTLTLDSKTNRIFLMGAEFPPAPPRPPGGGQGNPNPMVPDSFSILVVVK